MADSGVRAIVLLSGGIDSAVSAAIALERGFELFALSFRYGQRHAIECDAAAKIAQSLSIQHHAFVDLDLRAFGGSALTSEIAVPKLSSGAAPPTDQIPITYVPARNTIFLSFALAQAEVVDARAIFIGVNALDYSGYPDCRPDFINTFEQLAKVATRAGADGHPVKIHAPLIRLSKSEIIREGLRLGVDFSLTHSCYDPTANGLSCGRCESCYYRQKGFVDAGVADPTRYA